MKPHFSASFSNYSARLPWFTLFSVCVLLCSSLVSASAQGGNPSPYAEENDGSDAGGKWAAFRSEDKMTAGKRVRFELRSDNTFREDPQYNPRVDIFCENGKYRQSEFNPGVRLGPPNRPGFWGQPQTEVRVRVDDSHSRHGWNWVRGHFLLMDKGTTREMIRSQVFNVELRTPNGVRIAEFSPAGLDLGEVRKACDLTPKKPD